MSKRVGDGNEHSGGFREDMQLTQIDSFSFQIIRVIYSTNKLHHSLMVIATHVGVIPLYYSLTMSSTPIGWLYHCTPVSESSTLIGVLRKAPLPCH